VPRLPRVRAMVVVWMVVVVGGIVLFSIIGLAHN
jgi:hypothetical protein